MIPAIRQFPQFDKGSPSSEFQQITNFCVNYLDGMLVNLMHMEIPEELITHQSPIKALQKQLLSRERTVRHTFQFQLEKFFADFKSSRRTRIRSHHSGSGTLSGITDQKASRIQDIIDSVSRKHQDSHNTQLEYTGRRLKTLVHRSDEIKQDNPVSPLIICQAFLASIETLNISGQKNLNLFSLLDYNLQQQLRDFYNQIDLGLYSLGILPELTDPSLYTDLSDTSAVPQSAPMSDQDKPVTASLLQANNRTKDGKTELEVLFMDFKKATFAGGTLQIKTLLEELNTRIEPLLTSEQMHEIRTFSFYYTNLLSNSVFSEPLKLQLSRLTSPFLDLVQEDPGFYKSQTHPVNDLILSIVDFELRFEHKGELLIVLSRLIESLLEKQPTIQADYQPFIDEYEASKLNEVMRLTKIKQSKVEEVKLKSELLQIVNEITADLIVDHETMQFFYDDWQLFQLHIAQTAGKDSEEFKQAIAIAKSLAWVLDDNKKGLHPDYPINSFKTVLSAIDNGLVALNYSGEHRHRTRKLLVTEYKKSNRKQSFNHMPSEQKLNPEKLKLMSINPGIKVHTTADLRLQAESIKIGDWLEIKLKHNNEFTPAKLKWKTADNNQFVFIDHQGHKVKQINLKDLNRDIAAGDIKPFIKPVSQHKFNLE